MAEAMDSSTSRSAPHMYAHREYEILFRLETMIDGVDKLPSHTIWALSPKKGP